VLFYLGANPAIRFTRGQRAELTVGNLFIFGSKNKKDFRFYRG